jgi:hypothetical protein
VRLGERRATFWEHEFLGRVCPVLSNARVELHGDALATTVAAIACVGDPDLLLLNATPASRPTCDAIVEHLECPLCRNPNRWDD